MDNEVRKIVGSSPGEVLRKFLDEREPCSIEGWFTGIVVNNNDPDKEGKCRIRVYGVLGDEIPDNHLPWALPDFNFIGSKLGSFIVPPVGAIVKVYFDDGDIYLPHYTTKAVNSKSLPSQRITNYPDNMVFFETDEGEYFTINRSTKLTKYHHNSGNEITIDVNGVSTFTHKTGTVIEIDALGNVKIEPAVGRKIENGGGMFVVTPDSAKFGPFCALQFDTLTGAPLQGNTVYRTL